MGYRKPDKIPKPEDMLARFDVRNGAIMRVTFGCYYTARGHNPHYHDYINWPAPNYHPGPICQMHPPRDKFRWMNPITGQPIKLDPIHLVEEGYSIVKVSYEDDDIAEYLTTEASIDQSTDNLVRLKVHANLPVFHDEPKEVRFTIFISKSDGSAIDAVCHGIIVILPGSPFPEDEED